MTAFKEAATATLATIVQAIAIDCSVAKALSFMRDAPQWLPWAMPGVESVQPLPFGQWLVKTATQLLKLRPSYDAGSNIFIYELVNPLAGAWHVPVQLMPTPTGCHLAVTFVKPEYLPLQVFENGMQHTASGLRSLKLALEHC